MLDDILKREDVQTLLYEICNSARYYNKKSTNFDTGQLFVDCEQALFVFYDALVKYKIIIDDLCYFDKYIEQLAKLMKKVDNFYDISCGINRIIGNICSTKLGLEETDSFSSKEKILRYIYDAYVVNGYFVHAIASVYKDRIKKEGFIPEKYDNLYSKFNKIKEIFLKHEVFDVVDKDFQLEKVFFTDSIIMGCYYGVYSPMYFSKLVCNRDYIDSDNYGAYFKRDYKLCFSNLMKLCKKAQLSEEERKFVLDTCCEQWKLLDGNSSICLMFVKRKLFSMNYLEEIDVIIERCADISLDDSIEKIICSRHKKVSCADFIDSPNISIVEFPLNQVLKKESDQKDFSLSFLEGNSFELNDVNGRVSVLLLIGAILITLGVIFTIIMISGGM